MQKLEESQELFDEALSSGRSRKARHDINNELQLLVYYFSKSRTSENPKEVLEAAEKFNQCIRRIKELNNVS